MQLLVIRHAIAEDRDEFAKSNKDDDLRPLTKEGRRKMRANASGLRNLVEKIDALAASPLVRAKETAAIVAAEYDDIAVFVLQELTPDATFDSLVDWLRKRTESGVVAVVGHEPHLGELVTWLLTGVEDSHIELRKGGACLVEFEGRAAKGKGTLKWLATPSLLRT